MKRLKTLTTITLTTLALSANLAIAQEPLPPSPGVLADTTTYRHAARQALPGVGVTVPHSHRKLYIALAAVGTGAAVGIIMGMQHGHSVPSQPVTAGFGPNYANR